jgi:hypothetical protein
MNGTFLPTVNAMFEDSNVRRNDLEVSQQLDNGITMAPLHIDIKKRGDEQIIHETNYPKCDTSLLHPEQSESTNYMNLALRQISSAFLPGIFLIH